MYIYLYTCQSLYLRKKTFIIMWSCSISTWQDIQHYWSNSICYKISSLQNGTIFKSTFDIRLTLPMFNVTYYELISAITLLSKTWDPKYVKKTCLFLKSIFLCNSAKKHHLMLKLKGVTSYQAKRYHLIL